MLWQTFAERWFDSGGGNTQILSDIEFERSRAAAAGGLGGAASSAHNVVLLGGPASNSVTRRLQSLLPVTFVPASEQSRAAAGQIGAGEEGYYYGVGNCLFGPEGHALVTLGPLDETGSGGMVAVVDGQDYKAFVGAGDLLADGLFDVNHWQHRQADFVITDSTFGSKGAQAVVATGFWGNRWEYAPESSYLSC